MSDLSREEEMQLRFQEMAEDPDAYFEKSRSRGGWISATERDRRALDIIHDPDTPLPIQRTLVNAMLLRLKLARVVGR